MKSKTIVTISGIRPDFIRMSEIYKKLDHEFNHILIHTGQHYDKNLSDVFFEDLDIRPPDYTLSAGTNGTGHHYQLSYLSVAIINLFKEKNINPDLILFLGDSNTVCASMPLKKEGYKIGHVEAGMRSHDKRMLEEINRTVCDHCSDLLFVYHDDYKENLRRENVTQNVFNVGNTIVEVCKPFIPTEDKKYDMILVDIHRPENFKYEQRLRGIIEYAKICQSRYKLPVKMLKFKPTMDHIEKYGIDTDGIELIDLLSFKEYLKTVYHSLFIISDSGTAQEEPAFLKTKVIVPRDYTERPQSVDNNCSFMLDLDGQKFESSFRWLESGGVAKTEWLGDGTTSQQVISIIKDYFRCQFKVRSKVVQDPYPYLTQDNILDEDFARDLRDEILSVDESKWDRYNNPFEQKYTLRDKYNFPPKCSTLFGYLSSEEFILHLSEIFGVRMYADPTRNFWGIHKYDTGDYLDIHTDAGFHPSLKKKKQLTFGIYLSSDGWSEDDKCALELWKGDSAHDDNAKIYEKSASLLPVFNRLVAFSNTDDSWHGNPEPTQSKDKKRIFLTISYLSDQLDYENKKVKAFFVPRPTDEYDEHKDKLRFLRCDPDKYKDVYSVTM